jgi:hypothetical protein
MINRQQEINDVAVAIGIDLREAALGVQLARTGRADLIAEVIAGRMTIRAALARAEPSHASSQRAAATSNGSKRNRT